MFTFVPLSLSIMILMFKPLGQICQNVYVSPFFKKKEPTLQWRKDAYSNALVYLNSLFACLKNLAESSVRWFIVKEKRLEEKV